MFIVMSYGHDFYNRTFLPSGWSQPYVRCSFPLQTDRATASSVKGYFEMPSCLNAIVAVVIHPCPPRSASSSWKGLESSGKEQHRFPCEPPTKPSR